MRLVQVCVFSFLGGEMFLSWVGTFYFNQVFNVSLVASPKLLICIKGHSLSNNSSSTRHVYTQSQNAMSFEAFIIRANSPWSRINHLTQSTDAFTWWECPHTRRSQGQGSCFLVKLVSNL